jgi:hypothetical protein
MALLQNSDGYIEFREKKIEANGTARERQAGTNTSGAGV